MGEVIALPRRPEPTEDEMIRFLAMTDFGYTDAMAGAIIKQSRRRQPALTGG